MTTMRILITGANGQLAKSVQQSNSLHTIIMAPRTVINIEDKDDVYSKVEAIKPDIVYHFASMTRGDECAADPEKAYRINVLGTQHIAEVTAKLGIPILFVSTNEVFDGTSTEPYSEGDLPKPITIIGKIKLQAEDIITKTNPQHYIIRTMWLYSRWSNNFIHAVLKRARQLGSIQLVMDEIGSPTNSLDLAKAIEKLVMTNKYGLYHLTNEGEASRLDFGKEVFDLSHVEASITSVKLDDFKRLSKPPLYSVLKNTRAKELGISLRDWRDALKDFLATEQL